MKQSNIFDINAIQVDPEMCEYHHRGNSRRIFERALKELGLTHDYLKWRLGVSLSQSFDLSDKHLPVNEYFAICEILHLDVDVIQTGYNRPMHKARIAQAQRDGRLMIPRTAGLCRMLRERRRAESKNNRYEANHYGFRLLWRIRLARWKRLFPNAFVRFRNQIQARNELIEEVRAGKLHRQGPRAEANNCTDGIPGLRIKLDFIKHPNPVTPKTAFLNCSRFLRKIKLS